MRVNECASVLAFVCIRACSSVSMPACVFCVSVSICADVCVHVCLRACMCVCLCVCSYLFSFKTGTGKCPYYITTILLLEAKDNVMVAKTNP